VADFLFEVDGFDGEFRVLSFQGTEAISELFEFGINVSCEDPEIDIDSIVGQPAVLTIRHEHGARNILGIVSRFEQGIVGEHATSYFIELVPQMWLQTQYFGSRIFQNMTIPAIIEQVFGDTGMDDQYRLSLSETYPEREYCVQYRESNWNFVNRLMEEVGIFYFFEHTDDGCKMVIGDSDSAVTPIEGEDTVVFREPSGTVAEHEAVFEYRYSQEIRPGTAKYRSFDFKRPTLDLDKEDEAERDTNLRVYDYPGKYIEPADGEKAATVSLQTMQARRVLGTGQSVCRRFLPGYMFSLDEHRRSDFNREYLLTYVAHSGTQPSGRQAGGARFEYNNEFRCIPSDTPFRPPRKTPKPVVEGTQTAIVTGPSGEEIYPDEFGRVKIQFHWDLEGELDENTSCWVRVSQLWAGCGWGAMWIPRIGHEVIVDFLEGDPDKPIIIGRVYHGDNMPPYGLPDDKTKSTIKSDSSPGSGGFNELRFEDKAGSEEIFIHAQKDMNEVIENDMSQSVGNDRTRTVGNDEKVEIGKDQTIVIEENCAITVKKGNLSMTSSAGENNISAKGDSNVSTDANANTKAGADRSVEAGANYSAKAGANMALEAGAAMTAKAINIGLEASAAVTAKGAALASLESDAQVQIKGGAMVTLDGPMISASGSTISLSAGGSSISISAAGVTISGAMVKIN